MYNYENIGMPQGWQCPVCKRVYSPSTPMCYCCGGDTIASNVTTNPKEIDWKTLLTTITANVDPNAEPKVHLEDTDGIFPFKTEV